MNELLFICIGSHILDASKLEFEPELIFNLSSAVYTVG